MADYTQIIITIVTVAGSAGIWKFMEARLKTKSEDKRFDRSNSDGVQYRDDLKERVKRLETLLEQTSDEKDELQKQIVGLTAEVHALRVKVEFLDKENDRLKNK